LAEIWKLLEGMDTCRMGDLDDALSQILVDLKPYELEASRWHFEDTFGVEIDTVMKVIMCSRRTVMLKIKCTPPHTPPPHAPHVVCLKKLMIASL
jgi:hypothetical protein